MMTLKEVIHGRTHLQIGKKGVSQEAINQILALFKKNKYLKIRFLDLGDFESVDMAMEDLLKKVPAKKKDKRGNTVVIEKIRRTK